MVLAFILALIAGAGTPMQASVNNKTSDIIRSTYLTAGVNFIVAGLMMSAVVLAIDHDLYIPLGTIAREPWWIWLGGVCGATIITLNVFCLPQLGSARTTMLLCLGQTMTGLLIDHFGLFYSRQIPMGLVRAAGAVLVILGIILANKTGNHERQRSMLIGRENPGRASEGSVLLYSILAVICGVACSTQVAVNGTLAGYAGSAFKATVISMAVGLITMSLVCVLMTLLRGRDAVYDRGSIPAKFGFRPWMLLGGALAMTIVGGNAIAGPVLGTGIATILNLVGMMAASLTIDATGFLGIDKKPVTAVKIIGMILMIAGAAIISLL